MNYNELMAAARAKASRATTRRECDTAIMDCHDTLVTGGYGPADAYGLKLWAEIDAYRDRLLALIAAEMKARPSRQTEPYGC